MFISRANIRDAMAIDNFRNPIVEEEILQKIEVIEFKESLLQVAETIEIDEEQEKVENEVMPLYSDLHEHETREIVGALQAVQWKIRWEIEAERKEKQIQLSISRFFG